MHLQHCAPMRTTIEHPEEAPAYRIDDETGLPVVSSKKPITPDDIKALEDEP